MLTLLFDHPALKLSATVSSAALWVGWVAFFITAMLHNASVHRHASTRIVDH